MEVNYIKVVGLEAKRSDTSPLGRKIQRDVLELLLDGKDRKTVKSYILRVINNIKNKKYSVDEIGIPKGISRRLDAYKANAPHIRAAKYMNENFNKNFGMGSKPKFIWISRVPSGYPITDVIAFDSAEDFPEGFVVDYEKMIDRTVTHSLDRLMEILEWDGMYEKQVQSTLF